MTNLERLQAIMNYQNYDRVPVVHFGFWKETLDAWAEQGHFSAEDAKKYYNGACEHRQFCRKLGFDFGWGDSGIGTNMGLAPAFEKKVIEEMPDGSKKVMNHYGVIELEVPGATSIAAEIDHTLKDRKSWEEEFLPKLQFFEDRINYKRLEEIKAEDEAGREEPRWLNCGSMIGTIRNWLGVQGLSYLWIDDPELYDEIIDHCANLIYTCLEKVLATGVKADFGHFWEDICFKNGPLVAPSVFEEKCGPNYRKITGLLKKHGINMASVDCDGCIDALISTWLENGVNTMFPIEVGTWEASIKPWREKYGRELRGVGGMNKTVFGYDYAAIDAEVERLKPLVDLGGYIPCPDHRIAPEAKLENVQYYCELMHKTFS